MPENARERFPLYDTVMVMNNCSTMYPNAAWYNQYADLGAPAEIPFLNVRNRSIGAAYNNFDSAEKLPFVYHIYAMGIYFTPPTVSTMKIGETAPTATNQVRASDIYFATEMARHSSMILKVGQDEKWVGSSDMLPAGQGVSGWVRHLDATAQTLGGSVQTFNNGEPANRNVWVFPEPISVPRDRQISGVLTLSSNLRDALKKASGPGYWLNTTETDYPDKYPAASLIQVILGGYREVQPRNQLTFSS